MATEILDFYLTEDRTFELEVEVTSDQREVTLSFAIYDVDGRRETQATIHAPASTVPTDRFTLWTAARYLDMKDVKFTRVAPIIDGKEESIPGPDL